MKSNFILLSLFIAITGCISTQPNLTSIKTICNPMNLEYRFQLDGVSRREAADPTVIYFKGEYYLFASKSGGYWYSTDLTDWKLIQTSDIPVEDYAPTAVVIGDAIYFMASSNSNCPIYKISDPKSGKWQLVRDDFPIAAFDPDFFLDDDGRLYLYWGCSNKNPIYGIEINPKTFDPIGKPDSLIFPNPQENGWENPGDNNQLIHQAPWIEGAWMNKINGRYYLQYAGPGTEYKSYSDGLYIAEKPLGPYKLAENNPFASKPGGFACGAGHGSTFADRYGNYWHIGTMTISQKHVFERRLGLFPVFTDENNNIYSFTCFGDYPLYIPEKKIKDFQDIFPGWMLLSYNKKVIVSSSIDTLTPARSNDEDIRTYWAAKSGTDKEWVLIDLGKNYDVYAVQINFAEHNTRLFGRVDSSSHQFLIEFANDTLHWNNLIDKSENKTGHSHYYFSLPEKVNCRYLRIKNIQVPDGHFAVSDFRIFGKGTENFPEPVKEILCKRNYPDKRSVNIKWSKSPGTFGYNICYGTQENKLYLNYQVYNDTTININNLDANRTYFFSIQAFNENGISRNSKVVKTD